MPDFADKTIMITGAAGNVAGGIIDKFARMNARLALVDYDRDQLAERLNGRNLPDPLLLGADLGKPEEVHETIQQITERFGQIDVLAHTVGGFAMGDPVHALDMDAFHKMMYLNAQITYVTCGAVAAHMIDKGVQGAMVAILAKAGLSGGANMASYSASKAAAERIVQSMAQELKEHHIRINGIMPSIVDTPLNRQDMPKADFSKWVTPAQIADAVAFLASPDAEAISGVSLPVYNRV